MKKGCKKYALICGIYKITSPTGKIYIGQSNDIEESFTYRYKGLRCQSQVAIYRSLKKYGPENHIFQIICVCEEHELNEWEIYYIKFFNTFNSPHGLNLTEGGNSGRRSDETKRRMSEAAKNMTEEHRRNLSKANMGKSNGPLSEEHKKKISVANTGRKNTEETKKKMSISQSGANNYWYGKKQSEEHKKKVIESRKGYVHSPETREKLRIANTGFVPSKETREKLRLANLGKKLTEETKRKIGDKSKGRKDSDEVRKKKSIGAMGNKNNLGKIASDEKRKKISIANSGEGNGMFGKKQSAESIAKRISKLKGKKRTPEQVKKMTEARNKVGRFVSEETRKKMSESAKLYNYKKRNGLI